MVGTLVNRTVRPSAIVGCVRMASRSPVYGSPANRHPDYGVHHCERAARHEHPPDDAVRPALRHTQPVHP